MTLETIKLDSFKDYRFLSSLQLAPDGKTAALLCAQADFEGNGYRRNLALVSENRPPLFLTSAGDVGFFLWEDNRTLLFSSRREEKERDNRESTSFFRLPIDGGEAKKAFTVPLTVVGARALEQGKYLLTVNWDMRFSKAYTLSEKAQEALLRVKRQEEDYQVVDELPFYFNGQGFTNFHRTSLFLFEEEGGRLTRISKENMEVCGVELSPDKSRVLYTAYPDGAHRKTHQGIYATSLKTGETTTLLPPRSFSVEQAWFWGKGTVLFLGTQGKRYGLNENPQFYLLEESTGKISFLAAPDESFGSSVGSDCRLGGGKSFCKTKKGLYTIATRRNESDLVLLTEKGELETILSGEGSVDCLDADEAGENLLFIGMKAMELQEVYAPGKKPRALTAFNQEALQGKYVASPKKLTFQHDGVEIDGWVLFPKDFDASKQYPGILDIHGGPKTVYGEVFYHEMQFWANEGYFVFFCNPRGSDGRGNEFADIRGRYGTIDYEDIMAFTDQVLKRHPQIREDSLYVTGGSYGGFMTNWIIGHTSRFQAAASQRSIANWIGFGFTSDIGETFARDQTVRGRNQTVWNSTEEFWEHSPLKYAQACKTPTLFIHSDEDYRCPLSEGYQMYSALRQNGVKARLCIFRGENHELSRSGKPLHRVRRLKEITEWFAKH